MFFCFFSGPKSGRLPPTRANLLGTSATRPTGAWEGEGEGGLGGGPGKGGLRALRSPMVVSVTGRRRLQCDCGAHLGGCKCADGPTSKRSIIDAGQPCDCRSTCEDVAQMDTETDPRHCRHQELLLAVTKNCGRIHVGAFYICSAASVNVSVNVSACIRVCEPRASSCEDRSFQAPAAASTGPDYQTRRGRHEAQELGDDPAS